MHKLIQYKEEIIKALQDLQTFSTFSNKGGRFDLNKDAEEFYRGLLNIVFSWNLLNANTEKDPNYEGVDLLCSTNKIAVQITSENDTEKIHKSIKGFRNKALKQGYQELYILMFRGKGKYPSVNFSKSIKDTFVFDKNKHILDNSNLCEKLKDANFSYIKDIYTYLEDFDCISYGGIDEPIEDLNIIDEIFGYIFDNIPKHTTSIETMQKSKSITKLKIKIPLNFPPEQTKRLIDMIKNTYDKRILVEEFLKKSEEEIKISDLVEEIQDRYCKIRNVSDSEEPINSIIFIDELAKSILPKQKIPNIHYLANSKAIILHFFEFCYIGKKTTQEVSQQKSLFD